MINKSKLTEKELEIFREGKAIALRQVLAGLHEDNKNFWNHQAFDDGELYNMVMAEISALRDRLDKARLIYVQNMKIIRQMSQLSID